MTRRLPLLLVAAIALAGCTDDPATEPLADDPPTVAAPGDDGSTAPDPTPTDEPSEDDGFGSSVETGTADVQSDVEVRVAETISTFEGRVVADGTLLTVPAEVLFDFDEATLRADAVADLERLEEVLTFYADAPVRVTGHTDAQGTDDYNLDLSQRRAEAVADFFVAAGVAADRLEVEGRGEDEPVASNDTDAGRQQNRRVEILLVGVTQGAG